MTPVKLISPAEAQALLTEGYVYVDVRTEPEFEAGHPPGALNVPIAQPAPGAMAPNLDFMSVMERAFGKDEKIIVGCKAGGRSRRAADALSRAGFTNIVDMSAGWDGGRDDFGQALPGWSRQGLPIELGKPAGCGYEDVKQRVR